MRRDAILDEAKRLTMGDRAEQYGDFREQMAAIADAFNAMYSCDDAPVLMPRHVAFLMMLLKLRRIVTSGDHDSVIDLAAYAALNGQYFIEDSDD